MLVGHKSVSEIQSKYICRDSNLKKKKAYVSFFLHDHFLNVATTFKIPIDVINNECEAEINFSKLSRI